MSSCDINGELEMMERYLITPNELFVFQLLLRIKDKNNLNDLIRFIRVDENKQVFRNCLYSLQAKGAIVKTYKIPNEGDDYNPSEIPLNTNFFKNYVKSSSELGEELFDIYPYFANINGVLTPIRSISKHFNSIDDAYRFYAKSIKWNIDLHNHILDLVKWDQDNSHLIVCSFSSFIINRLWETIEAAKNGEHMNINYDAIKML